MIEPTPIKTCPFCGQAPQVRFNRVSQCGPRSLGKVITAVIKCDGCQVRMRGIGNDRNASLQEAAEKWNTRS